MSRKRAVNRDDVNRRLAGSFVNAHGLGEIRPRGTAHIGVGVPVARIAGSRGCWWRGGRDFHGGLGPHVLDYAVIPRVAVLVAKHDRVTGHGIGRVRLFQPLGQGRGLARRGMGEVDTIHVRSRGRRSGGSGVVVVVVAGELAVVAGDFAVAGAGDVFAAAGEVFVVAGEVLGAAGEVCAKL